MTRNRGIAILVGFILAYTVLLWAFEGSGCSAIFMLIFFISLTVAILKFFIGIFELLEWPFEWLVDKVLKNKLGQFDRWQIGAAILGIILGTLLVATIYKVLSFLVN